MIFQINPTQFFPDVNEILAVINNFFELSFFYMKFIFAGIMLIMGVLTLLSLRGRYFLERLRYSKEEKLADNPLTKPRLIIGTLYVIIGFGVIFNWFTYFLIFTLNPLPDRFIFVFIEFTGSVDPFYLNRVSDIQLAQLEYEKTIYYGFAAISYISVLSILISARQLILGSGKDSKKAIITLTGGVMMGILFGFTTGLPLLL